MSNKIFQFAFAGLLATLFISSCKKTTTPTVVPPGPGTVGIEFMHVWGMTEAPFALNSLMVHPVTGDSLTFTKFRYYVSNIRLKKEDGTWWAEPNSYHIVDQAVSTELDLDAVPAGNYTDLEFVLGVDSIRNVSGAQDGALSVTEGMFWDWNSGYIMLKAEGTSPDATANNFAFHLGGFSGSNNIVTTKSISFGTDKLLVDANKAPAIHLKANVAKLWHASPSVSVTNTIHMPGAGAKTMADNFYASFAFEELHQ